MPRTAAFRISLLPQPRITRVAWVALALLLAVFLGGCNGDPVERTLTRLDEMTALLDSHDEDPDALLDALEAYVDAHAGQWEADRAAVDALDEEARQRLEAKHERALQRSVGAFMEATQHAQDRLRDDPEKLARFLALLERVR